MPFQIKLPLRMKRRPAAHSTGPDGELKRTLLQLAVLYRVSHARVAERQRRTGMDKRCRRMAAEMNVMQNLLFAMVDELAADDAVRAP
jgi:hypothetical protein